MWQQAKPKTAGRGETMSDESGRAGAIVEPTITEEQLKQVQKLNEEEEGATNRMGGWLGAFLTAVAVATSIYHLYAAYDIVPAAFFRPSHVGLVLFLVYLLFPVLPRFRDRTRWWDWVLALLSVATIGYM